MVEEKNYIEDIKLPIELDYKALKEEGLAYIQKHSSNQWTNLNPSDPGVTILDQLCYAFTELGYCNNFPIKDILTDSDGTLQIENQFYLPENILTTSPITIDDYCKYIIDRIPSIINCSIEAILPNVYQIYILTHTPTSGTSPNVCDEVFFAVNNVRNLGEYFLAPKPLSPLAYNLSGNLEIEEGYDLDDIITKIDYTINNYIFPRILQTGYDKLREEGISVNEIFNGPKLKRGWTHNIKLDAKKNIIEAFEIQKEIQSVPGVISIHDISFRAKKGIGKLYTVTSNKDQILVLDFIASVGKGGLVSITRKGKVLDSIINNDYLAIMASAHQSSAQIENVEAVQMAPVLPIGKYRDISNYYSIQNTFPEIYAVGENALEANAPSFQIAQSRQLKGYLTLFDQVLTNQFTQLANIGTLFSFKTPMTGTPSDEKQYNETKNDREKKYPQYPAPYKIFSPTYFYQSLYDTVPHIRPLLKNNDAFKFSFESKSEKELVNDSWRAYKNDPYNAYIHGLMSFMEDEEVNLDRRNNVLNHLLARHGESPVVIDSMLSTQQYTANPKKSQAIIKSLLLQNYDTLSYYRAKAYNYVGATKLSPDLKAITKAYRQKLLQGNQTDFIFDTEAIDKQQHINSIDYQNYATIVLKLNVLLAIDSYFHHYLVTPDLDDQSALWLLTNRKGFFFIETDLLKEFLEYEIFIKIDISKSICITTEQKLSYLHAIEIDQFLRTLETKDADAIKTYIHQEIDASITFKEVATSPIPLDKFDRVDGIPYSWAIGITLEDGPFLPILDPSLYNTVLLMFPEFIKEGQESYFQERVNFFLEEELPIQLESKVYYKKQEVIEAVIPVYVAWHNSLICNPNSKNEESDLSVTQSSLALLEIIVKYFHNDD
ncbi:MAG: hypothetical protein ACI9Y7_000200 [Dokdonia sp.]|jgi:hypothetical protein